MVNCTNCGLEIEGQFKFCPSCGTQVFEAPAADESLLGKTFNQKYRMVSELGSGSMGTVYLAEHIGLKKQVAIKVLRADLQVSEDSLKRFQREGIAAGKFTHPYAIQIFDFDRSEDQTCYLAMEYVKGTTLKEMIGSDGRFPIETAVDIASQVLSVLEEAHREGIVHRDLKPENIMVLEGGNGEKTIKVLDFGLSKLVDLPAEDSIQTQVGRIIGSPRYMAPEQCSGGAVDHRIDLYAVGLILFEMLSGESPFKGETLTEIMMKRISEPAPGLSEMHPDLRVPEDLETFFRKALQRDPADRFQSAGEMIEVLQEISYTRIAKPGAKRLDRSRRPEPGGAGEAARPARRGMVIAVCGGLAVITIAVALIMVLTGNGSSGPGIDFPLVSMKSPEDRTEIENRYVSRLQEARNQLRSREYDIALAAIEEALLLACADAEVYLVRGLIYHKRGDLDMARADFDEALRIEQDYAAAAAGLGWVRLDRSEAAAALEQFEKAAAMDKNCAEALAGQGAAHYLLGDRAKAQELLAAAIEHDASIAFAHYYLGKALLEDGKPDEAVDAFIQAKRHDTKNPDAYIGLGEAYLQRGEFDQAERQFRDTLNLDSSALEARIALAALLVERERFAEAQPLLEEGIKRHAGIGKLHVLLGVTREAAGLTDQAIQSLRKGVELAPNDVDAQVLLGILLQRQGDDPGAIEQYRAASRAGGSSALPFVNEGLTLFSLGQYEAAGDAFSKAVSIDSSNAFAYYNLGVLYMDYLEQNELAIEYFRRFEKLGGLDTERNRKVRRWLEDQGY